MKPKDIINMMIECDAGMHANAHVREQSKLLCTMIVEHENEIEHEHHEDDFEGDAGGGKKKKVVLGSRARVTLEPFLAGLYDDRRKEFESEIGFLEEKKTKAKKSTSKRKKKSAVTKKAKETESKDKTEEKGTEKGTEKLPNAAEFGSGKAITVVFNAGSLSDENVGFDIF